MGDWAVYYGDGSVRSSRKGDTPWTIPAPNVQAVVNEETTDRGFTVTHTKDVYVWREGRWIGCDQLGFYDYMFVLPPGPKRALAGRTMVRDEAYWAIVNRAQEEGLG